MAHSTADVPNIFTRVSPLEHGFKYYSKLPTCTCTYLRSAIRNTTALRSTARVPSKYYLGTFEIPLQYLKSTARVLSKYRTGTLQVPLSTVPFPYRYRTVPVLLLTFFWHVLYMYVCMYHKICLEYSKNIRPHYCTTQG